jgi:sugar lactone lactonase YvrE
MGVDTAPSPSDAAGPAPAPDAAAADLRPATPDAGPADGEPGPAFPLDAVKAAKPELYVNIDGHKEGPSWRNGDLFVARDGSGLVRIGADRKAYRYFPQLAPAGSYLLADGSLLLCERTHTVVQVFPDDKVGVLATGGIFCNDLTVDGDGNIYFSDYGETNGSVYRITPAGQQGKVVTGLLAPNGVEVDPDSAFLYIAVNHSEVARVALGKAGPAGAPETVLKMSVGVDGMAFDDWGHLWLAIFTPGTLGVFDTARRQVIASVNAGGTKVTNLTFGGPNRDVVFTTVDTGGIYRIPAGVRGFAGHPGAAKYTVKQYLDLTPSKQPL